MHLRFIYVFSWFDNQGLFIHSPVEHPDYFSVIFTSMNKAAIDLHIPIFVLDVSFSNIIW